MDLRPFNTFDDAEINAVTEVLRSGCLSGFLGRWSDAFYGGPRVRQLEDAWSAFFKVGHSVSVNSATSGLILALGAIGLKPDDEVIVSPVSMCASATAPLHYFAKPVFADVDPETYTLDPLSVARAITSKTRAIIAVNLFGHPAALQELMELAEIKGLYVIEDNAQAPGAYYQGHYAGTVGHIGVFSLNYHKHIHAGEGGICVSHDALLAERIALLRNHAEAIAADHAVPGGDALVGGNYRMTEIEAAIAAVQLAKLPAVLRTKQAQAARLTHALRDIPGLTPPRVRPGCTHAYYTYPLRIQADKAGKTRAELVRSLLDKKIPIVERYTAPLYQLPIFKNRGLAPDSVCSVAEALFESELCYIPWCGYDFSDADVDTMAEAIRGALN